MKGRFFYYKRLIFVILIGVFVAFKLGYLFFGVFQIQVFMQSALQPYSKSMLAKTLPGLEIKDESVVILRHPGDVFEAIFSLAFGFKSQHPNSLFTAQFTPLRTNHSRVVAMVEDDSFEEVDSGQEGPEEAKSIGYHEDVFSRRIENVVDSEKLRKNEQNEQDDKEFNTEKPKILIYHTHTTESFVPTSGEAFTENTDESIVKVGEVIAQKLEEIGLKVIHNTEVHDLPTRHESYVRSLKTVKNILENNPQIKMIVDLHRDGVRREVTTAKAGDEKYAKILFLVGSRDNHPDWKKNYEFARMLDYQLEEIKPEISRGIKTRQYSYNQEVHPRSVLIEVGGHENSLGEVLKSVPYLTEAIKNTYARLDKLQE